MKRNSGFALCLYNVIGGAALTGLSVYLEIPTVAFFAMYTLIMLMLLPACSTKN